MELGTVSNFEKNIKAKLNLHVDKVFYFLRILCSFVYYLNNTSHVARKQKYLQFRIWFVIVKESVGCAAFLKMSEKADVC